jgi:hypothetical protein
MYRRWKQDVSSQSGLVSPHAHKISRRSVDIPPHRRNMNTPHASYPIDRSCSSLKRKRAAPIILSASRVRDTLTLWHLISRVDAGDRGRVFDRIAALTPVPAGVSRAQALKLDPETLQRWKDELAWKW